jgi:hypothetical protein
LTCLPAAQSALAFMYEVGTGVPQDRERARVLRKAAAKWELGRLSNFYFDAAQGKGGSIVADVQCVLPFVAYLRRS